MADPTSVCNEALALLGQRLINDIAEESPTARKCRAFYNSTVELVFEAAPWPFAKTRKSLPKDTAYSLLAGKNAFVLPNKLGKIVSPRGNEYRREGDFILTDWPSVTLVYTRQLAAGKWPAHFVKTVAAHLASELAYPITESNTKSGQMYALYESRLENARGELSDVGRDDESEDMQRAHG